MILAWYVRCERKKNCNRHPSLESQWCAFWLDPVWKWTKWGVATILDSWWNIQACNVYFAEGSSGGGVAKHCLDQRETFGRWRLLSDVIEHCNVLHRLQDTSQTARHYTDTTKTLQDSVWQECSVGKRLSAAAVVCLASGATRSIRPRVRRHQLILLSDYRHDLIYIYIYILYI